MSTGANPDGRRPAISVVVPYYDSERFIAGCIESLRAQNGVDGGHEIVFVDNGSRDGSPSIVSRYDEIIHLRETKPGAYAARNTGIRRARGEIIAFTDADCEVQPDWLESILQAMSPPDVGVVIGHCRFPRSASLALHLLGAYENAKAEYVITRCPGELHFAYGNNMAVRAELFASIGLFKEWRRAADSELVHRAATERPDLRIDFSRQMRITHMEFLTAKQRIRRLLLYARTNSKISDFKELDPGRRLGVLLQLLRLRRRPRKGRRG